MNGLLDRKKRLVASVSLKKMTSMGITDQALPIKISAAIPWILQKNTSNGTDKLLTQISECQYQLLLLMYGLAQKDISFIQKLAFLKDSPPDDNDWNSFHDLLKTKFELSVSILYDIFVCALELCPPTNINIPNNFLKVISFYGKDKGLLHMASLANKVELIKVILTLEFNVNERNDKGETPLHVAASKGHTETVEVLLNHGAWHFALTNDGYNSLWLAVLNNCPSTCELLLKRTVNVNVKLPQNRTLIRQAAESDSIELVKLLIKYGANLSLEYNNNLTLLHIVAAKGYRCIAEILVNEGAPVNAMNKSRCQPIHVAANYGYHSIIEVLLRKGALIDAKDNKNNTPLILAINNKHKAATELLISEGADVEIENCFKKRPLLIAVEQGDISLIKLLVAFGANINLQHSGGPSLLLIAIEHGDISVIKTLIELGAHINHKTNFYSTPLNKAIKKGDVEIVDILIKSGADVNLCDFNLSELRNGLPVTMNMEDMSPLHCAVAVNNLPLVNLLLKAGAKIPTGHKKKVLLEITKSEDIRNCILNNVPNLIENNLN